MLTKKQVDDYLKSPIPKCPYCGSREIVGNAVEVTRSAASQEIRCHGCEKTWFDLYALAGIEENEDRKGPLMEIIRTEEWGTRLVRVGKCCGQELYLDGFTNTCEFCGADYNWAGQLLTPRDQWGEETGEHPADILRIK